MPIPTPQAVHGIDGRHRSERRRRRRPAHLHRAQGRDEPHHLLGREHQRSARRRHAECRRRDDRRRGGRGVLVRARRRTARSTAGATTTTASSRSAATPCARPPRPFPASRTSARWPPAARTTAPRPTTRTARGRCSAGARTAAVSSAICRRPTRPRRRASRRWQPVGIAAGRAHTCAFGADKELRCWGSGASGQLGQPPGSDMVITSPTVTDLGGPEGGDGVYAVGGRRVAHLRGRDDLGVGPLLRPQRRRPARQRHAGRPGRSGPGAVAARQAEDAGGGRRAHLRARRRARSGAGAAATRVSWATELGVEHATPTAIALGDGVTRRRTRSSRARRTPARWRAGGSSAGDATPTDRWARRCRCRC